MKKIIIFFLLVLTQLIFADTKTSSNSSSPVNSKYAKWQDPAFFRGYNILYESQKTLQDFKDFKNYGGNLFMIGTRGFMGEDAPYEIKNEYIAGTDGLVDLCRQTGIYYVIAVRSGPGAYDTYLESSNQSPESRIWNNGNLTEQHKYGDMLRMIVQRYQNDTLFAGINVVVEPRPKVRLIPANNSALYKTFLEQVYNIHMDYIYTYFMNQIRLVDANIPVILENFGYSTPELFPPYTINNTNIVYATHNYQPIQYTKAAVPFTVSYPGTYWNITMLAQVRYDSAFIRNTLFSRVKEYQQSSNLPIFLGEFGMFLPQTGGENYINDVLTMCKDYGWHFALWDWRRRSGMNWSIETFNDPGNMHWKSVLKNFNAPPVPAQLLPVNGGTISTMVPAFQWDSLSQYTKYDIRILGGIYKQVFSVNDLTSSHWVYSGPALRPGTTYSWQIRSKNPGGLIENNSNWSTLHTFTTPGTLTGTDPNTGIPEVYKLAQNYPNPFNPETKIKFQLPKSSQVNITLFDAAGREVKSLFADFSTAGYYEVTVNGSNLSSGVYFYKISAGDFSEIKKMILLK